MTSALVLGRNCFVVLARALPNGVNTRPGVTVLLALDEPMDLEFDGWLQCGLRAVVVAPGCRRRFLHTCRHVSVTVEPGHRLYRSFLAWSLAQGQTALGISTERVSELAGKVDLLSSTSGMDLWLQELLARFGRAGQEQINDKLQVLLDLLGEMEALGAPAQAEVVWPAFAAIYPGSTSAHARWLKSEIGLSLRQFLLWRKLRTAMDMLAGPLDATAIAHAAGFADSSHLWRTCTRAFGLQPSRAADRKTVQVRPLQFA